MKVFLSIFFFIVLTISAFAQEELTMKDFLVVKQIGKDLEEVKGKWFIKNTQIPYTGLFVDQSDTKNNIRTEGYIKYGVYDGIIITYDSIGQKRREANYSYGEPVEIRSYYPNGQLMIQDFFKNGKRVGWKWWYSTGMLRRESIYIENGDIILTETEKYSELVRNAEHQFIKGNNKRAIKAYSKAIKLLPTYDKTYLDRAKVYLKDLKFEKAIRDYDKALELEPLNMSVLSNRAFANIQQYELNINDTLRNRKSIKSSNDKLEIPTENLQLICNDLKMAKGHLQKEENNKVIQAIRVYCQ